ncbi:class I adenylate-forming enzyme family protein [Streptomyces durhamensis]|uniref:class I adenylate-forming enzyme family protein n=1 Tax=Streptomyces durhamensis TaxID=68194 RepID=UPI000692347F|nr:class I adenylate-forming enzyme family protein [Streptomyces durhamensis]
MRVVPDLLARRTAAAPDRTALVTPDGETLTYADWYDRTLRAADALLTRGLTPGRRVALVIRDRDILDFAVAYLAVQLAGGVPVIASARWSAHELAGLLREAHATGAITSAGLPRPELPDAWHCTTPELIAQGRRTELRDAAGPDDLAQILFTSATTGRAKAVAATHRNLVDAFRDRVVDDPAELARGEVFVHALPLGTNAAQSMLLTCLTEPDVTVVLDGFEPEAFCTAVRTHRATGTLMVPAMAHALLSFTGPHSDDLASLRVLGLTGAATPPPTLARLAALCPQATIKNFYTSTEAWPVGVNTEYDPARPHSVGRPGDADTLLVRLPDGTAAATGQTGEVMLRGGAGAGRGYLGQGDGFAEDDGWVHTGDLGRLDEEGYLYLVDRSSRIISSGGFKIAPQEVEEVLLRHPALADAAVFGIPHPVLGALLVAAVVPDPAAGFTAPPGERELRDHVAAWLSPVKVPHRFLTFDRLPLTAGDKVDVRALRARYEALRPLYEPPVGPTEQAVCAVWQQVLPVDRVGRKDDFFEIGGDSITAVRATALLAERLGVELALSALYDSRTPEALAVAAVEAAGRTPHPGDAPAAEPDGADLPCSPLQTKVWEVAGITGAGGRISPPAANVHHSVLLDGPLDPARLQAAVHRLCDRHAILRTVFAERDGRVRQQVTGTARLTLRTTALPQAADARHPALAAAVAEADATAFELTAGPTALLAVFLLGDGTALLRWVFSASVADGWTTGLLTRDLAELYRDPDRDPVPAPSFGAHITAWERLLASPEGERRRTHWSRSLADAVALPAFPGGRTDAPLLMDRSSAFELEPSRVNEVKALARFLGATPYAVWVAAYAVVLTAWTPAAPVSFFVPVLGRPWNGSDEVAGPCAAQSALRFTPGADDSVEDLVGNVRDRLVEMQHNLLPTLRGAAGVEIDQLGTMQFVSLAEDVSDPDFGDRRVLPAPDGSRPGGELPEDGWPGCALAAHLGRRTDADGRESHLFDLCHDSRVLPDGPAFLRALDAVLAFVTRSPLGKLSEARAAAVDAWHPAGV